MRPHPKRRRAHRSSPSVFSGDLPTATWTHASPWFCSRRRSGQGLGGGDGLRISITGDAGVTSTFGVKKSTALSLSDIYCTTEVTGLVIF